MTGDPWLIAGGRTLDADSGRLSDPLDIRLRDGTIAEIRPAADPTRRPDERVLHAEGMLVMPGLVNAHFHSTGTFNRAFVENLPLELFMLYELPPFDFGPFPGELYRTQAAWASAQMLKSGVTAVMDDAMFYPAAEDETLDALMTGFRDSGIRATVAVYLPNKVEYDWIPGLKELLPADVVERMSQSSATVDELIDLYAGFVDRWHATSDGRIRCALSCSAPQRATDEYMRRLHELSRSRELPFVFHVYETKLQRVSADRFYGKSMVRHLRELGVLDERSIIIHAVWVDDADIADLAEAGAVVIHSPCGNLRCGSGVMPYRRLRSAGVPVALCTDEATVEDRCNLWNVGRLAGMLHTIGDPDYRTWPSAGEILDAMTVVGARSFGLGDELGTVSDGALADIILVELSQVLESPLAKPATALVYGEDGRSVRDVFVAGDLVVRNRELLTIDEADLAADVAQWGERWAEEIAPVERWAEQLSPAYEEIYSRCARTDVGVNRWVGNEGTWLGKGIT